MDRTGDDGDKYPPARWTGKVGQRLEAAAVAPRGNSLPSRTVNARLRASSRLWSPPLPGSAGLR
jgi:hypothetical protein